jgi:2-methylcitrate dehydratase PrpD
LSLPFAIALTLQFETIGIDRFTTKAIVSSATLRLTRRERFDVKADWVAGVERDFLVTKRNGGSFDGHVPAALGDPENPVAPDQVVQKFEGWCPDGWEQLNRTTSSPMGYHMAI